MKEIRTKDKIEGNCLIVHVPQKNTEQESYLFCDLIEYIHDHDEKYTFFDHHLMFYRKLGKKYQLIFKVWLPNDKKEDEFANIGDAIKSVGMFFRELK